MDRRPDAFLADILETPDDDTPRMIYADWLDERGEADRAAFIRVQCELARDFPEPSPYGTYPFPLWSEDRSTRWKDLIHRQSELLTDVNSREWGYTPPMGVFDCRQVFRRGFVTSMILSSLTWVTHADCIRRQCPVMNVGLTTWPQFEYQYVDIPRSGKDDFPMTLFGRPVLMRRMEARLMGRPNSHRLPIPHDMPTHQDTIDFLNYVLAAEWPRIVFTHPAPMEAQ